MKKGILKTLCGLMAALMLLVFAGTPVTTQAAKLPYYIKINRQQNCVTVYALDSKGKYTKPVKAFACSVGVNNATPTGTFSIPAKYRWHTLMGGVYGQYCSRIHGGVLFHSVFYSSQDPSRLAYNSYNRLGQTASHGCVRLNVEDAKWIYDSKDPGPLGKPTPIRIDVNSPYRGWDPTDPDPRNPWLKLRPTIKGIANKTIERTNRKVDLKKGVEASDYRGKTLKFTVSGKVNAAKTGKYKITYTAKDAKGNKTQKSIVITVKDTKAPSISLTRQTLTYNEAVSKEKLVSAIKSDVVAKDLGKKLASKYVFVNTQEVQKAVTAMKNKKYGTYSVTVYAKDAAGNVSKKLKVKINFVNPNPGTDQPDQPEPDTPGVVTDSAITVQ